MGKSLTNEEFLNKLKDLDIKHIPLEEYKGYNSKIKWMCYKNSKHIFEATPSNIFNNRGCPYCSCHKVFIGETDMWTTNPKIASMLANYEDGYRYFTHSSKKTDWICPNCKSIIKNKTISSVSRRGLCCLNCSDGVSFAEKYLRTMLDQLNINYSYDVSTEWSENKRYDFYLFDYSMIIETHGMQHYSKGFYTINKTRTVEYEKQNDKYKKELAIKNGVKHYIELDCKYSNSEYIKKSILNSELNILFDLSSINWDKCELSTVNSLMLNIVNIWNNGVKSSRKIANDIKLHESTVIKYLRNANKLGLCDYHPHYYREGKKVLCVETGKIYRSLGSVKEDGYCNIHISKCCNKEYKTAYGLHWQFI